MADELNPNERGMLDAWRPMQPPADFVDRVVTTRLIRRRLVPAAIAATAVACAAIAFAIVLPRSRAKQAISIEATTPVAQAPAVALAAPDAGAPAIAVDAALAPVTTSSGVDMTLVAGETATIHDPQGSTMIRFMFGRCSGPVTVELGRSPQLRALGGSDFMDLQVRAGTWGYRVRCDDGDGLVVQGRVTVIKDSGKRPLPKMPALNSISADGRTYRISYQSAIPDVKIELGNLGTLHLASKGNELTFATGSATSVVIAGNKLAEGTYTYWGDDPKQVSKLIISFDQTAPQVYIDDPKDGAGPWPSEIEIRGSALPNWTAAVDRIQLPIVDGRFMTKVPLPATRALVLRFTHPQRGIHYYLRRPTAGSADDRNKGN